MIQCMHGGSIFLMAKTSIQKAKDQSKILDEIISFVFFVCVFGIHHFEIGLNQYRACYYVISILDCPILKWHTENPPPLPQSLHLS